MDNFTFSYQELYQFTNTILLNLGCSVDDASIASKVLLSADLRGIDSHGVARLSGYVRLWQANRINANPNIQKI